MGGKLTLKKHVTLSELLTRFLYTLPAEAVVTKLEAAAVLRALDQSIFNSYRQAARLAGPAANAQASARPADSSSAADDNLVGDSAVKVAKRETGKRSMPAPQVVDERGRRNERIQAQILRRSLGAPRR